MREVRERLGVSVCGVKLGFGGSRRENGEGGFKGKVRAIGLFLYLVDSLRSLALFVESKTPRAWHCFPRMFFAKWRSLLSDHPLRTYCGLCVEKS